MMKNKETFIKTMHLIKPYSFFVVISIICSLISVCGQLFIPFFCGKAIDFMLGEILNTLKLHRGEELEQVDNKVTNKVANKSDEMVLSLLNKDGALTIAQLARLMNMSDSGIKKILALLKREGRIKRVGSNKNGCWVVV